MNKVFVFLFFSLACLQFTAGAFAEDTNIKGKLLIVGGALQRDNESVYRAFINARPNQEGDIAIIPAASGSPSKNAEKFKADLIRYGITADKIHVLPIATVDDRSTEDIDESQWRKNADDPRLISVLENIAGFWFIGGDQMRIAQAIRPKADQTTRLFQLLQRRLKAGAVIGGTSAGAAIMSDPMIASGDSFLSVVAPTRTKKDKQKNTRGELELHHGLGFFPFGIVDQHFDARARLGRLIRALAISGVKQGYAVDENTGVLMDLSTGKLTVLGTGSVTIIDAHSASFANTPFSAQGIDISVLAPGDAYAIDTQQVSIGKKPNDIPSVLGREYHDHQAHHGAGHALGQSSLGNFLGRELVDNAGAQEVRRYNFIEKTGGFYYRFYQNKKSNAYWRHIDGTREQYTIVNVGVDIQTVDIKVHEK